MSARKPERAPIDWAHQPDGTWLLTAHAPRDGAGRPKGNTWTYVVSDETFRAMRDAMTWSLAGAP